MVDKDLSMKIGYWNFIVQCILLVEDNIEAHFNRRWVLVLSIMLEALMIGYSSVQLLNSNSSVGSFLDDKVLLRYSKYWKGWDLPIIGKKSPFNLVVKGILMLYYMCDLFFRAMPILFVYRYLTINMTNEGEKILVLGMVWICTFIVRSFFLTVFFIIPPNQSSRAKSRKEKGKNLYSDDYLDWRKEYEPWEEYTCSLTFLWEALKDGFGSNTSVFLVQLGRHKVSYNSQIPKYNVLAEEMFSFAVAGACVTWGFFNGLWEEVTPDSDKPQFEYFCALCGIIFGIMIAIRKHILYGYVDEVKKRFGETVKYVIPTLDREDVTGYDAAKALPALKNLIENEDFDPNEINIAKGAPIIKYCLMAGDKKSAEYLVDNRADAWLRDDRGCYPFVGCIFTDIEKTRECVDYVLSLGTEEEIQDRLNGRSLLGCTPIWTAAEHGKYDWVVYLYKKGCNPLIKDRKAASPGNPNYSGQTDGVDALEHVEELLRQRKVALKTKGKFWIKGERLEGMRKVRKFLRAVKDDPYKKESRSNFLSASNLSVNEQMTLSEPNGGTFPQSPEHTTL